MQSLAPSVTEIILFFSLQILSLERNVILHSCGEYSLSFIRKERSVEMCDFLNVGKLPHEIQACESYHSEKSPVQCQL